MNLTKCVTKGRWRTEYLVDETGEIVQKQCRKCNAIKDLSEFYPKSDCLAGRRSECSECELEENRIYHRSDKKRTAARKQKWREASRDKNIKTLRKWYNANKDEINRKRRAKGHLSNYRRRKRLEALLNDFTEEQRKETLAHFGGCALTGSTENVQFDHVIPVSTGHAGTTVWNMLPITEELNLSKSTKHVVHWFYINQERFNLSEEKFIGALEYLAEVGGMDFEYFLDYIDWCHENKILEEF